MKRYCKTCGVELILNENFSPADKKYGKVKCRKCQNEYHRQLAKNRTSDQILRRKISTSLSEHKKKGYSVKGTISDYVNTYTNRCKFCGIEFDLFNKNGYMRGSMDRIENSKSISPNNIQWLCHKCNLIKQNMSNKEFLIYIEKIQPILVDLCK